LFIAVALRNQVSCASTSVAWIADTAAHRLRLDAGRIGVAEWERQHGVEGAIRRHDAAVTSNPTHIRKIVDATRARLTIETI
jgi:hypothetical protein